MVWQRKKEQAQSPPVRHDIDVQAVEVGNTPPAGHLVELPPPPPTGTAVESRLKSLAELRDKNLISQAEYESKRQQLWPSFEVHPRREGRKRASLRACQRVFDCLHRQE
ncbi:MAG TPA: SHOCT domain-containing protein [Verrucomicrobiae bacterium]